MSPPIRHWSLYQIRNKRWGIQLSEIKRERFPTKNLFWWEMRNFVELGCANVMLVLFILFCFYHVSFFLPMSLFREIIRFYLCEVLVYCPSVLSS